MASASPQDTDQQIDHRLEALHEALLANRAAPPSTADPKLAGAEQCLKLLERVRKQAGPRDSDWLFGASVEPTGGGGPAIDSPCEFAGMRLDRDLAPRQIGRFSIERRIGEGGFGIVFLAIDPALNRRVALKLPRPEAIVSSRWRERFLREAEAAALLDHPGIVPVFEVGRAGSMCYIVQAWCDGVSLDRWLAARKGPVSPLAAARLIQMLAETVQHAHSRGVLHRDIKPSNILLEVASSTAGNPLREKSAGADTAEMRSEATVDGTAAIDSVKRGQSSPDNASAAAIAEDQLAAVARLADFGLARLVDRGAGQTQSGAVIGTPSYMAPEQAEGLTRQLGVTSDVYALGAVLFELLTGRPPFQEETLLATLQAVREREAPRPRQLNRKVPIDLEAICLKCLEKDQRRRYATARELADDLSRFLRGEGTAARAAGRLERLGRWCRRKPLLAGLSAAIVLLVASLLVGSTAATVMLSQERQKTLDHLQDVILARDKATQNEDLALGALYEARLAQTQAQRRSGRLGQRLGSLDAAAAAARLVPRLKLGKADTLRLRNEVIASLSLVDLALDKDWTDSTTRDRRAATSSDATHFAHGDAEWKTIFVRRMEDGAVIRRLAITGDCAQVLKICFSPDGKYLAAWCRPPRGAFTIQVWAIGDPPQADDQPPADQPPIVRLEAMTGTQHWPLDFSPDGKWLAMALPGGAIGLVAVPDFQQHARFAGNSLVEAVRFDPTSRLVAVARRGRVELIEVESGKILRSMACGSFAFHLEFSPSSDLLAAGCQDNQVRLWNVADGKPRGALVGHGAQVTRVAFHPGGRIVATTGYDHTMRLWDVARTRQLLQAEADFTGLSRDGRWLGAEAARFQMVLPEEHQVVHIPQAPQSTNTTAQQLSFESTGRFLAVSNNEQLVIFDLATNQATAVERMPGGWAGFDPGGKWLIATSNDGLYRFRVRREESGSQVEITIDNGQRLAAASPGYSAASRDGETVAVVDRVYRPKIVVHNASVNTTHTLLPYHSGARWLSVSPEGRWLATGPWHGRDVKIWDTRTGELRKTLPSGNARVHFSPDGEQLVVNESGHFTVWRVADWKPQHPRTEKSVAAVPGPIAYSPDGRWLAILDTPCEIRMLDAATLAEVATFKLDSEQFIDSLIFDPQGTRLIAGTIAPGSIHIWDLPVIERRLSELGLDWHYPPVPYRGPNEHIPASVTLNFTEMNSPDASQ